MFKKQVLELLVKMLGISHTLNTKVGSAYVRGVSGGERKRVSIAEMVSPACFVRGTSLTSRPDDDQCQRLLLGQLDSRTRREHCARLRQVSANPHRPLQDHHFCLALPGSLARHSDGIEADDCVQAGEGIYDQFDKVLVIDEGRQVYFGPVNEARKYMVGPLPFPSVIELSLPRRRPSVTPTCLARRRQTISRAAQVSLAFQASFRPSLTADIFADPNERRIAEGRDPSTVPTTPETLAAAYKESEIFSRMMAEKQEFKKLITEEKGRREEFVAAVKDTKRRGVGKKSPYTVSFYTQVKALTVRQCVSRRFPSFRSRLTFCCTQDPNQAPGQARPCCLVRHRPRRRPHCWIRLPRPPSDCCWSFYPRRSHLHRVCS